MNEVEYFYIINKKHWYKKWWGIILIILIVFFVSALPLFVYEFINAYKDMRAGLYISPETLAENMPYQMSSIVDPMSPWMGKEDGKIVIVEFGDFNCPATLKSFPVMRQVLEKYKDQVKFYWRNYPTVQENSAQLALAGVCANRQNKFWPMHDLFFFDQGNFALTEINNLAKEAGLDVAEFEKCYNNDYNMAQIRKDYYVAEDNKVGGTPTFFINGFKVDGHVPFTNWVEIIDKLLPIYEKNN